MADEAQTVRMVKCVKLGKELPGLDRIPWKGDIGKRVYEHVSKDAWKMWVDHSKMLLDPGGNSASTPWTPTRRKLWKSRWSNSSSATARSHPKASSYPNISCRLGILAPAASFFFVGARSASGGCPARDLASMLPIRCACRDFCVRRQLTPLC